MALGAHAIPWMLAMTVTLAPPDAWAQTRFLPRADQVVLPVSAHAVGDVTRELKAAEQNWRQNPSTSMWRHATPDRLFCWA